MYEELRRRVLDATLSLPKHGLVTLTWGNVSEIDRQHGVVAIKPSGVPYDDLTLASIVIVDPAGNVVEGDLNPSVDLATHLEIYRTLPGVGAVVHTHSTHAVSWAQRGEGIPCLGTTHADYFEGTIPCTRPMTEEELFADYAVSTAVVIKEAFVGRNPLETQAVLVFGHGPFVWGPNPKKAVENAVALERVAEMANLTCGPGVPRGLPNEYVRKHYQVRRSPEASYGQNTNASTAS